jgi:hypothetical protein
MLASTFHNSATCGRMCSISIRTEGSPNLSRTQFGLRSPTAEQTNSDHWRDRGGTTLYENYYGTLFHVHPNLKYLVSSPSFDLAVAAQLGNRYNKRSVANSPALYVVFLPWPLLLFLPRPVPRLVFLSASNAFIIGALLRPDLDCSITDAINNKGINTF